MDFITIIIFLGIVQGILLGILLLTINRGNAKANRLLGILMILFSFSITDFGIARTGTYEDFSFFIGVPNTVLFLFGPVFYFYVLALTKLSYKFSKKSLLHFLPFIVMVIYSFPYYLQNTEEKLFSVNVSHFSVEVTITLGLQIIHLFIYLIFIKKILKEHEEKIKSNLSSIENINLRWINLSIFMFVFVFVLMTLFLILSLSGYNILDYFNTVIPVLVSIIIMGMGYLGLKQPIIFPLEEENKPKRYERSCLTDDKADESLNKLKFIMEEDKPYLYSDLTLNKLAEYVGVTQHHLSQIINERMNQNFFDFINSYRVEEAKKLLVDPRGELLTILAIAEESGFNSKSSFNAAFKKYTGKTPTEYKKSFSAYKEV